MTIRLSKEESQFERRLIRSNDVHEIALYETEARYFHRDTGVLAPGKSESDADPSGLSTEERRALFEEWRKNKPYYYWVLEVVILRDLLRQCIQTFDRFAPDDLTIDNYRAYFTSEQFALLRDIE